MKPDIRRHLFIVAAALVILTVGLPRPDVAAVDAAAPPQAFIKGLTKVEVDSDRIRLGELVRIESDAPEFARRLAEILIGRSPLAGQTRPIGSDYILLRLRQSGFDPQRLAIELPNQIEVRRGAVVVARDDLEMLVRDHVMTAGLFGQNDFRITQVHIPEDVILPKGRIEHEIQIQTPDRPVGTLPVHVLFRVNGQLARRIMVGVKLEIMQEVLVASRPIPRFKTITADDLAYQVLDAAKLPADLVLTAAEAVGKRARRAIPVQTVLRQDLIELPPVVQKGDRVLIVAASRGLRITALGEVKHTGKVGERIPVENLSSSKTIMARVVDHQTVQVDF